MAIEVPNFPVSDSVVSSSAPERKRIPTLLRIGWAVPCVMLIASLSSIMWGPMLQAFAEIRAAGVADEPGKHLYWLGVAVFGRESQPLFLCFAMTNFTSMACLLIEIDKIERIVEGKAFGGPVDTLWGFYTVAAWVSFVFGGAVSGLCALLGCTSESSYLYRVAIVQNAAIAVFLYIGLVTCGMGMFELLDGKAESARSTIVVPDDGYSPTRARKSLEIQPDPEVWGGKQ